MVLSILLHGYLVKYGSGGVIFLTHINCIYVLVLSCILQPWMSEKILSVKREKQKSKRVLRKTKLTVHLEIFRALCLKLKTLIYDAKENCYKKQISD